MWAKRSYLKLSKFVFPSRGTHRPLCEVAPRESAGPLLGTLLGGASQFGSRAICIVIDRFPVNDGPCLPSGAAKPCMVQTTPADSPRREVDRGTDAIFTFDERYNIDHIVPLQGHFCPIIGIQATHPGNAPRETSTATAPTHGSEQTQQPVRGVVGSWGTRRGLHPCAEGFSRFWPFLARNAHETAKNGHIGRFTYTTHRCHSTTMPRSSPINSVGRGMANRPELRAWSE